MKSYSSNSLRTAFVAILVTNPPLIDSGNAQNLGQTENDSAEFSATALTIDDTNIGISWYWPGEDTNFFIQYSSSLESQNWKNLTRYGIIENNGTYVATISTTSQHGREFYRVGAIDSTSEIVDLTSLDQLEDSDNIGKTIRVNKSFNLQGQTIQIPAGVTLLPAGGMLANGTIGGEGFTISTSAKSRIFHHDLKFAPLYSQTFLPEWYGARADGVTNDSPALVCAIEASKKIELWAGKNYLLEDPVAVDRENSVIIEGNGSKIITNNIQNDYVFRFGAQFEVVDLRRVHIDGGNEAGSGISAFNNFKGDRLDLRNFYNEDAEAIALHLEVTKKAEILLENSTIDHVKSPPNGQIGDAIGASRAVRIYWRHTDPDSVVRIRGNSLTRAYGDDGDLIQVAQNNNIYTHSSKTIIQDNYIAYGTRRLIKGTAANITLSGNTFESMELDHPEGEGVTKTYMLSFGPFLGGFGENADFVPGVVVKDNIIDNTLGYEGTLGLIQTDGAIVEGNTFENGKLIFAQHNKNSLVRDNELNDSTIEMGWNPTVLGDMRIIDNHGAIDTRDRTNPIYGFFIMHPGADLEELTMQGNTVSVIEDREHSFLGFILCHPGTQIKALRLLENTLARERGNREHTRSDFIYSYSNFGEDSEVRDNRIVTDQNNVSRGLYFRNVPSPFSFEYSGNTNSFNQELLPVSGTAF